MSSAATRFFSIIEPIYLLAGHLSNTDILNLVLTTLSLKYDAKRVNLITSPTSRRGMVKNMHFTRSLQMILLEFHIPLELLSRVPKLDLLAPSTSANKSSCRIPTSAYNRLDETGFPGTLNLRDHSVQQAWIPGYGEALAELLKVKIFFDANEQPTEPFLWLQNSEAK
ncbi:hypothetical protein KI688_006268 [Linnemannia hyalina]|uniref:Uncharacterized protein n=1 Tax=Linnemannia hyalina TaxID=64524 RepID=A0A9P7Y607_9FUNG|nr:hypothetical protein KI688_006268 [Linnemannia hyalina]